LKNKKTIKKIIISLIILSFLIINIPVLSENNHQQDAINEEIVIIKIGEAQNGNNPIYKKISYSQTQQIIEKLKNLKLQLNQDQIDDLTYISDFIKIFQDEKILPKEISLELLIEISDLISKNKYLDNEKINGITNLSNDASIHIGKKTIIASLGIGNYLVRRIIPIRPYRFINLLDKEILRRYNLTSTFSYAAACMWTPGPSGYHVLHSFNPIIGFEAFSHKIFNNKSIGGVFLLGANISLEAFSSDGTKVFFDATIGIYGADLMIGF
jgi:hypothetical protein